ncbi:hypothetical protein XFF7766_1110002 [Xanthomonas citri pv. fuscans]|nr:hypothetical protein XFF7766_1110002 [Xanthomonas citri pv. fuscans]
MRFIQLANLVISSPDIFIPCNNTSPLI